MTFCENCNREYKNMIMHTITNKHKINIGEMEKKIINKKTKCNICNVFVNTSYYRKHCNTKKHICNDKKTIKMNNIEYCKLNEKENNIIFQNCEICEMDTNDTSSINEKEEEINKLAIEKTIEFINKELKINFSEPFTDNNGAWLNNKISSSDVNSILNEMRYQLKLEIEREEENIIPQEEDYEPFSNWKITTEKQEIKNNGDVKYEKIFKKKDDDESSISSKENSYINESFSDDD